MNTNRHQQETLAALDLTKVGDFLPHTGAMVLLDKITDYYESGLIAELTIRGDGLIGGDETSVPAWVGIEYMAQAIAAYIGIQAILAGEPIKLGYLLGTRRYNSNIAAFAVGTLLMVNIEKIMQDEKLGVFDCKITATDINVSANLNVYQPPTDIILKPYAE